MRSITREALIDRLTELEPRELVQPSVDGAIEALGWTGQEAFTASEVIALGTKMAELAQAQLAASEVPEHRRAASEMAPLIDTMQHDVVPVIGPQDEPGASR